MSPAPVPMADTRSAQLGVGQDLVQSQAFGVQDLAAQRQHGLGVVVAALLGRAAGRVAFDDEQLRFVQVGRFAIGQLAGQVEAALRGRLAFDLGGRLARRQPGLGRQHDPADDLVGGRLVGVEPGFQSRAHEVVHRRPSSPGCSASPWSAPGTSARGQTPTGCRPFPRGCPRP